MKIRSSEQALSPSIKQLSDKAVSDILDQKNTLLEALFFQLNNTSEITKNLQSIKNKFKRFAVVGIGGSSLGIQAMAQFFAKTNFTFFDNVDAVEFESQMNQLGNLDEVYWIFISKSGETIETLAALEFIDQIYLEQNKNLKTQCLVITENKKSSLSDWASLNHVIKFEIPLAVGGRYSTLSFVGLVPAYLMGLDLNRLAEGSKQAIHDRNNLVDFVSECLASFERKEWITVLWSYSSRLKIFGLWWQQLWAESLAKKVDLTGAQAPRVSTPLCLVGATDQHSVLQQINEGFHDKFVLFLRLQAAEEGQYRLRATQTAQTGALKGLRLGDLLKAEALATQQSLTEVSVSNMTLLQDDISEQSLGYLMMFMQVAVLAIGKALNLNPLNQPGVEFGKVLCKKNLAEINKEIS